MKAQQQLVSTWSGSLRHSAGLRAPQPSSMDAMPAITVEHAGQPQRAEFFAAQTEHDRGGGGEPTKSGQQRANGTHLGCGYDNRRKSSRHQATTL